MMHGAVKESAAAHRTIGADRLSDNDQGYGFLFAAVKAELEKPDLMFANLETPIAPKADQGSRSFVFNAPVATASALKHAGIDVVSVANNHSYDQGPKGFIETLEHLDEVGLPYVGGGRVPDEFGERTCNLKGISIAMMGWAQFFNSPPGNESIRAALFETNRAEAVVRSAARRADVVVVSLHWGQEYRMTPRPEEVALAHRLAEAGATVILGHHPHVLEPVEIYHRRDGSRSLIAYSLGNFISNQSRTYQFDSMPEKEGAPRDGALLRVTITKEVDLHGIAQVAIQGADYIPLWTENSQGTLQVVSIDAALAQLQSQPILNKNKQSLYLGREAVIAKTLGADVIQGKQ